MTDLFNRKDILTIATADKAVIGTKGFFGDNLNNIIDAVKQNKIRTLSYVDMLATYNFWSNEEMNYMFFLPLDKVNKVNNVKNKEPVYRPIKTIEELFNFLIPYFDADIHDTYEKAELTLRRMYELKSKQTGNICYKRFSQIYISDDYIRLDEFNLEHLFKIYEIKKDGGFVPFGILEK